MHQFTELKYLRFQFYDILNGIKTNCDILSNNDKFQFYDILNGIKTGSFLNIISSGFSSMTF